MLLPAPDPPVSRQRREVAPLPQCHNATMSPCHRLAIMLMNQRRKARSESSLIDDIKADEPFDDDDDDGTEIVKSAEEVSCHAAATMSQCHRGTSLALGGE